MTNEEVNEATLALLDWLESQRIDPADAVPVMAKAIVTCILALAEQHGGSREFELRGAAVAAKMIVDTIDAAPRGRP